VAYLGAMQSRGAKPWVSRLVLASAQRSALSAETDVRLYLPKALQRILATYHSRPALEALIDLRMDGAYAYDLYDVRLGALLADPAAWEVSLRSRPEEVPWTPEFARRSAEGVTRSLAWSLTEDVANQKRVRRLAQRPGLTPTMRRYANGLLWLAKLNRQGLAALGSVRPLYAYTVNDSQDVVRVVTAGQTPITVRGVSLGPWVPAWGGFAVLRSGAIESLDLTGRTLWRAKSDADGTPWSWAVDSAGRKYAEVDTDEPAWLLVRDLQGKARPVKIPRRTLERRFGRYWSYSLSYLPMAFSPSGRRLAFSHGFGGKVDNGGYVELRTAVLDVATGRITSLGTGIPVAWNGESSLLVRDDDSGQDRAVRLCSLSGKKGRQIKGVFGAGWTGTSWALFRRTNGRGYLQLWSPDLHRRLRTIRTPFENAEFYDGVQFSWR
jgi:hypothetical protein